MASIQSLGVGSGLLTSELVENIVAAEREATDLRITAKRAEFDAKISAFGGIRTTLDALQSASEALSTSSGLLSNSAVSSNPNALFATAQPEANPGVHTVEVLSLARSHTLVTGSYEDVNTIVGDGTLDIRFGTTTFSGGVYDSFAENEAIAGFSITIDESNNTLAGIRDSINAADGSVTASIVNDGSGYVLAISSSDSGADRSLEISVTEGAQVGLAALAFNAGASTAGVNLTQTVAADDSVVNVDGIVVRRDSNLIDEVIPGVSISATALNVGSPATITIAQDLDAIESRLQGFVDSFNDAKALADELTAFDEDAGSGALLIGDATLRSVSNQMRRFVGGVVSDLTSSSIRSLGDLGISTNQNAGYFLSFDAAKFRDAITSNPQDVVALLADESRSSDSGIEVTSFANSTAAGTYEVEVTRLASQGFVSGVATPSLAGAVTIDSDNDTFNLSVDGGSVKTVTLSQGSYTDADAVAREIQNQINVVFASGSVSVAFDATAQQLLITSDRYGASSQIAITSVDTNTETSLGLAVDDGVITRGNDVAGLVNGVEGSGSGQFLALPLGPAPARGARIFGESLAVFPLTVDASNDNFVLTQDGVSSNSIVLTQGSYADPFALAAELQSQIDLDTNFGGESLSVQVDYDPGANRFVLSGNTNGSSSELTLTAASTEFTTLTGLTAGQSARGQNEASRPDATAGLQIRVFGSETGSRGSVTLVRGVMNQLTRFLDTTLGSNGAIDNKFSLLEERLADIDKESADFNKKMDSLEERLRFQFAAADALISQLNNTSNFLQQQLASLPGYTPDDS